MLTGALTVILRTTVIYPAMPHQIIKTPVTCQATTFISQDCLTPAINSQQLSSVFWFRVLPTQHKRKAWRVFSSFGGISGSSKYTST